MTNLHPIFQRIFDDAYISKPKPKPKIIPNKIYTFTFESADGTKMILQGIGNNGELLADKLRLRLPHWFREKKVSYYAEYLNDESLRMD